MILFVDKYYVRHRACSVEKHAHFCCALSTRRWASKALDTLQDPLWQHQPPPTFFLFLSVLSYFHSLYYCLYLCLHQSSKSSSSSGNTYFIVALFLTVSFQSINYFFSLFLLFSFYFFSCCFIWTIKLVNLYSPSNLLFNTLSSPIHIGTWNCS
jgi:hypothetical protein